MIRQEMINDLIRNIELMNAHKVEKGTITKHELIDFMVQQRKIYEGKTDMQLKNLCVINF